MDFETLRMVVNIIIDEQRQHAPNSAQWQVLNDVLTNLNIQSDGLAMQFIEDRDDFLK